MNAAIMKPAVSICVMIAASFPPDPIAPGRSDQEAVAIIKSAISSAGGASKLERFDSYTFKSKVVHFDDAGQPHAYRYEFMRSGSDKERAVMVSESQPNSPTVFVVTGSDAWMKDGDRVIDLKGLKGDELKTKRAALAWAYVTRNLTPLLDDRETTLKSPKAVKDGHRDLLLVKAERAAGSADFYFDKQTNRLARVVMNLPPSDKSSIADIRIDSYLKVDGVLVPARWEIFENNRKQVEEEVTEVHFTKKLPAGVFDRP